MLYVVLELLVSIGLVLLVTTQIFIPLIYNKPFFPVFDRVRQKINRDKELAALKQEELEEKRRLNQLTTSIDREEIQNFEELARGIHDMDFAPTPKSGNKGERKK